MSNDIVPWCMLFVNDIILVIGGTESNARLDIMRITLEGKMLLINTAQIVYLDSVLVVQFNMERKDRVYVCIRDQVLYSNENFKYMRELICKGEGVEVGVTHHIKAGWLKWKWTIQVLCDKRISVKMKVNIFKVEVSPSMIYGSKCCLRRSM